MSNVLLMAAPLTIYFVLYNYPYYCAILIGSRLWSIRGQMHVFPCVKNGGKFWEFRHYFTWLGKDKVVVSIIVSFTLIVILASF